MGRMTTSARILLCVCTALAPAVASANVTINEVLFDDSGTDDREFIELFNAGSTTIDISGWTVGGRDLTTTNPTATIPSGTTLAPGAYYVLGNTGVLNVNQVVAANFLENDNETVELRDGTSALIDAMAVETNKGTTFYSGIPELQAQIGPGFFGNHSGSDLAGTPLNASVSIGRFVNGRDTNNNGRDFGLRPATPGTSNSPGGFMTAYQPADPAPLALGASPADTAGSFVNARVIDPTVADANNPNVISAPNGPGSKAYVAWDPSGGGNGITTTSVFNTSVASFTIRAYLETADLPVQFNSSNVQFKGSEITLYGIGSGDALTNLTDVTGAVGLSTATLPAAESGNGFTGYAWLYERVGTDAGGSPVSELLHLVDANDGGDSDLDGNTPMDWVVLKTYDLSMTSSGWFDLSISLDGAGNGTASFNGDVTLFSVAPEFHSGAFNVGYRENLQQGGDGTPDALLRPATYTIIPEPRAMALAAAGLLMVGRRRRRL